MSSSPLPSPSASPTWSSYESARQAAVLRSTARRQLRQAKRTQEGGYSPSSLKGKQSASSTIALKSERVHSLSASPPPSPSPGPDQPASLLTPGPAKQGGGEGQAGDVSARVMGLNSALRAVGFASAPVRAAKAAMPRPLRYFALTMSVGVFAAWAFFHFAMGARTVSQIKERVVGGGEL
eukprot:CAMPEP_0182484176 /NCGR_PEP_ID=MMETSP1319-20130603/42963_1 /TAXON_ID=172717 /ORGANISM="Bolidomonas pacifica, Strain RCC208" /LENGTH=179 /DNA_ID=CAMNT_0024686057 /DNA_START=104 /DNA_END=643 /DNA_ORIENTATION=+